MIYNWLKGNPERTVFLLFSLLVLGSVSLYILTQSFFPLLVCLALPGVALFILQPKKLYFLFFFLLPFSIEVYFENGLGTDLPAEPLMLGFLAISFVWFLTGFHKTSIEHLKNPITILLVAHMGWIFISSLTSQDPEVSFKFLLAKTWYIIPFYFLPIYLLKTGKGYRILIQWMLTGLTLAVLYVFIRHALEGFSFRSINRVVSPIFRNHVNYACLVIIAIPMWWAYIKWDKNMGVRKFLLILLGVLFVFAIYFSYTRVAYISLLLAVLAYILIRMQFLKIAVYVSLFVAILATGFILHQNQYLEYAPNYERTIAHNRFGDLVDATTKMEDISTMERVYRWVAGYQMVREKPWMGFGPGTFYFFYTSYTVSSFQTYVSDNPDKSGIHNYYLMTLVEQGIPGLIILVLLVLIGLFTGVDKYRAMTAGFRKDLLMASILILVMISSILVINDMVEAAKVGPFFFLSLAIIGNIERVAK